MNIVYVDSREQKRIKQAHNYFSKEKINKKPVKVETKQLKSADYAYKNIGVEFKTTQDFINSVKNGRLHKEVLQMNNDYEKTYVIIAGNIHETIRKEFWRIKNQKGKQEQHLNTRSYMGAIASYSQITNVIQVETTQQAFHLIRALFEKGTDNKNRSIPEPELKTNNPLVNFLSCIPGIKSKAPIIVEELNIKTLNDLINITTEDLTGINGIGKKKAGNIVKWLKK